MTCGAQADGTTFILKLLIERDFRELFSAVLKFILTFSRHTCKFLGNGNIKVMFWPI